MNRGKPKIPSQLQIPHDPGRPFAGPDLEYERASGVEARSRQTLAFHVERACTCGEVTAKTASGHRVGCKAIPLYWKRGKGGVVRIGLDEQEELYLQNRDPGDEDGA